jgi:cyclic beta-1,2-glucan synthetase
MNALKDENGLSIKIKKKAQDLGEKVLIVSKPEKAKNFLSLIKRDAVQTKKTYNKLIGQVKIYKHLTHEVESIFDNYYIVDSAISDILNTDVGKGFKNLVQFEKKPDIFIPRMHFILSELLKVTEYKIDRESLYLFLRIYQTKAHISIRELSFVPFFLRIILTENIERTMYKTVASLNDFKEAEYWFGQIVKRGDDKGKDYSKITSDLTLKYGVVPINLGFYLLQRLSQYGPDTRPIVKWLKLNLLKQGIDISDLAEIENKRQNDISNQIFNTINSLRWINQVRWDDFVVDVNIVDSFLIKDPTGIYASLDQASQSAYRNEVVKISDQAGIYESEVVKVALRLCQQSLADNKLTDNPENHVGFYLVGGGRAELEKKIGYQKPFLEKLQSFVIKNSSMVYVSTIFSINFILTFIFFTSFTLLINQTTAFFVLIFLAFIINCDVAINLVNIFISSLIPVRALFRLDLSSGVSLKQATFVVIPSMFRGGNDASALLRRLEVNFLGNNAENVYFALLMDFKDSKTEKTVFDQNLIDQICLGIEELNNKYPGTVKKFYLFFRKRVWNPQENVFMGWERKRGKLREFNLFLRNKRETSYVGSLPVDLPHIKYVLTIDEDTRLPKDSAIKLIGCIDHPLNRPVIDLSSGRVKSGYGIIQPRMTTKFSQAGATLFSRLFSSAAGIDSYSGPVADVYQDLFNNSIFYGKGIYDVDVMEVVIGDRIPENQVLSHDLLEGLYTRVGFATDISLFEGFPESYREYILRMNRWIRGDWQIIGWLSNNISRGKGFSLSDKWKIFDNLRRSILPIFIVCFVLFSYLVFPDLSFSPIFYALLIVGSPFIISYLFKLLEWPKEMSLFMKINSIFSNLGSVIWQTLFRFIFILDQAVTSFGAVSVSMFRMVFSRKHMLLWQNSHEVSKSLRGSLDEFIYIMWSTQIISLIGLFVVFNPEGFFLHLTLILWFFSPLFAYGISQKEKAYQHKVHDLKLLRKIACRSSRFFLELSSREGNRLIPDHYQEEPLINSPAATSPTNIGMHLLSNFTAYDLGYISFSNLLERTSELCENLDSLERFNGHFYNWYDIRTLQPLAPKYVSSVDSANLLLAIITLKRGILDILDKPLINKSSLEGFVDVLAVLAEDADLISKDYSISKSERRLARHIYNETDFVLNKFLSFPAVPSIDYFTKTLNIFSDFNEKIKKIISNLNLSLDKGLSNNIFSSVEHFNTLLKQQVEELSINMSYYQKRRTQPAVRNEKKNQLLIEALKDISLKLDLVPSLEYLCGSLKKEVENLNLVSLIHSSALDNNEKENMEHWYHQVINALSLAEKQAAKSKAKYSRVILSLDTFFDETDFAFLYNKERGLFHIGYNVTYGKIDNSYYDFLASEANSISFVSIIKKQVPVKHWFYLGRKLVRLDMKNVLLSSWGGSLFEYLTSLIFYKVHKESLLGHTAKLAIESHVKYGQKHKVPWGMGESAYSALDLNNNYQYQIFGHPSLGFKRDLKDYLVVAPYTTIMSLAFKPRAAISNLRRMIKSKFIGRYGFYDAIDYTSTLYNSTTPKDNQPAKIYYAHHQGFSLQALSNQINNDRIHSLFISDPRVESLDTLFEEKIPSSIPARPIENIERLKSEYLVNGDSDVEVKQFIPLHTSYPRQAFISNGSYRVNISNSGAGGSKVADLSLTRFREDTVAETLGQFIYLQDTVSGDIWSPTTLPCNVSSGKNKIEYFENKARFTKIHNDLESSLTVAVAPDSDVELRSLTVTNHSKDKKSFKVTSYGEVSLSRGDEDLHHPAFEKLFIKSEFWPKYNALVYTRPNKTKRGTNLYFVHKVSISPAAEVEPVHTTLRSEFVSRGGFMRLPDVLLSDNKYLKSGVGHNLDPIFCFQNKIELKSNETVTINYVNIFGDSKDDLIRNLRKYSGQKNINQAIKKSDKLGIEIIDSMGISRDQALNYQALASRLLAPHYSLQTKKFEADTAEAAVQTLWRLGVSGDLPILVVRFYDMKDLAVVKNILLCHKYLKYKGVAHDLVLLNEYPSSYIKSFEDEVDFLIRYNQSAVGKVVRGGIFHIKTSHISPSDRDKLISLAKILLDSKLGTIEQQILSILQSSTRMPLARLKPIKKVISSGKDIFPDLSKLKFFNGLGGFNEETNEYVLNVNYKTSLYTPSPWVNIIANKNIGFVITESGSMYTWLFDSYDNRLTKRLDDPLLDRSSEVFYLRDEETGEFWNPTPLPIKSLHTYTVKHGVGYTEIGHRSRGINQVMLTYVPKTDGVKIVKFKFTNTSKVSKKLSLTGFFEMSLGGANREYVRDYLKTEIDEKTGAVIVRNIFGESFKNTLAFVDLNNGNSLVTNDRDEFLGKNGGIDNPACLHRDKLSNLIYEDVDHCVALQTFFDLAPSAEVEITALIGGGHSVAEIEDLLVKYRNISQTETSLKEVKGDWLDVLNKIQIKTPDESLNILFNQRLLYQLISSRLLARTGYYQPSGAYGFRDQLQDSLALIWSKPEMTREIILKASRHQFLEGDGQNWWHEHNNFGVRNAFSDHQLWLAYVTSYYLEITGDVKILDEKESYLKAPLLDFINNPHWAGVPEVDTEKYDLYDHCLRALEKTFVFGKNGLPLIGNGDWNDGLNRVGEKGLGESVWLGWFLYTVINKFIPYIKHRGDHELVKRYETTARNLQAALEKKAWDGKWYKRAFFDNGVALGSHSNREFKIDSISQSWSVISHGAKIDRSKQAMASVNKYLLQDNNLLLLLSPAVKDTEMDPGYIKDYPAGVRENGAQYNHAALWSAQAFAELNDPTSMMKIIDSVNPIKRSDDKIKASLYKVEPYVVASDIYAKPAEAGRGGWTWYTGSAGVMYKTILENILGLKIKADKMEINPCIPKTWTDFSLIYSHKKTKYNIQVLNSSNSFANFPSKKNEVTKKIKVDGIVLSHHIIHLLDDGGEHKIEVEL